MLSQEEMDRKLAIAKDEMFEDGDYEFIPLNFIDDETLSKVRESLNLKENDKFLLAVSESTGQFIAYINPIAVVMNDEEYIASTPSKIDERVIKWAVAKR